MRGKSSRRRRSAFTHYNFRGRCKTQSQALPTTQTIGEGFRLSIHRTRPPLRKPIRCLSINKPHIQHRITSSSRLLSTFPSTHSTCKILRCTMNQPSNHQHSTLLLLSRASSLCPSRPLFLTHRGRNKMSTAASLSSKLETKKSKSGKNCFMISTVMLAMSKEHRQMPLSPHS